MKQIVLSEGKHDVHLISCFFEERGGKFELKEFLGEEIDSSLRKEESREIRNFQERRNPYHVLAKSENGKSDLKRVFCSLLDQLLRIDPEIVFLVDLDGGGLKSFLNDLDEQIQDRHRGKGLELGSHWMIKRNTDMVAADCEVLTANEKPKGEFRIVAFEQTLERVANVSRDDDTDEWKERIEAFLEEADHIYELLDAVFPDRVA